MKQKQYKTIPFLAILLGLTLSFTACSAFQIVSPSTEEADLSIHEEPEALSPPPSEPPTGTIPEQSTPEEEPPQEEPPSEQQPEDDASPEESEPVQDALEWDEHAGEGAPDPYPEKAEGQKNSSNTPKVVADKKKGTQSTTVSYTALTEQEKLIASMSGEVFLLFEDPSGIASLGLKLYRGNELEMDFGSYRGKLPDGQPSQMMLSGKMEEDGLNYQWKIMQSSGGTSSQKALSSTYLSDGRKLLRKAAINPETVQVRSGQEAVLGYIVYQPENGSSEWDSRYDIKLDANTTLDSIKDQLKKFTYSYVILASI